MDTSKVVEREQSFHGGGNVMTITIKDIDKMIDIADKQGFMILRIDLSRREYANLLFECDNIQLQYKGIPLRIASNSGILVMKKEDIPQAFDLMRYNAPSIGQNVINADFWKMEG